MFVDYENLYSVLTSQSSKSKKVSTYATEILDEVARYLEEGDDTPTIYGRAYGPFDVLHDTQDADVPSSLHRLGIEPVYEASAMQGNTSEIRLTVEATRFLEERADVRTIVIVTGDRPYLPLVRTIREMGGRALVAAVNPPQTDAYAESNLYLDARNLLSRESREGLLANAPDAESNSSNANNPISSTQRFERLENPVAKRTVEITEKHFGQYEEVYLTPLLRKLSDLLGSEHDPKALVSELEAAGAVRLEKRDGYPYDYTVLITNDDHPDIKEVQKEVDSSGTDTYTEAPSGNGSASRNKTGGEDKYHEYDEYAMDEAIASDPPDPSESLATADQAVEADNDSDAPDDSASQTQG